VGVAVIETKLDSAAGKVLMLGSESIGRGDDDLGYEILMAMLASLPPFY
jgi:hypothetical protein